LLRCSTAVTCIQYILITEIVGKKNMRVVDKAQGYGNITSK
jgi:hypothetical protein